MDVSNRDTIVQKITKAEKKLANLLRQKGEIEAELRSLKECLEKGAHQNIHSPSSDPIHQVSTTKILRF
jgi:peptidoglycan hydrolase CwlO-like protein